MHQDSLDIHTLCHGQHARTPCTALQTVSMFHCIAACSQLQEMLVALGWKERFSPANPFMVFDMGTHSPKAALPQSLFSYKSGASNKVRALPVQPIVYKHKTAIYHTYSRDLHFRSLYFDLTKDVDWPGSYFSAPGAIEAVLGTPVPFMVCMSVMGDWGMDRSASRFELSAGSQVRSEWQAGFFERRRRFFQVRLPARWSA